MRHFLSSHSSARVDIHGLPPAELIEERIDRTTNPPHWLWDGNVNQWGEAVLRWHPGKARPGTYVVARVLVTRLRDLVPGKWVRIASRCGVVSCVNPEHWEVVDPSPPRFVVVANFDGEGERVVSHPRLPRKPVDEQRVEMIDDSAQVKWKGVDTCPVCRAKRNQRCVQIAHDRARAEAQAGIKLWDCYICGAQNGLPCGVETHAALNRPL